MNKYKIHVPLESDFIEAVNQLISKGYLFFQLKRSSNIQEIIAHVKMANVHNDGELYVHWLIYGYSECNRIFGTAQLFGNDRYGTFGDESLYELITVEDFIQLDLLNK